ncbi:sulfatase-like hydrolase/transferase [Paraglaciecola aquimarina]|uniref:Sulfatase-like hydrolase/transferase n=1 Tax=Paraglaciecola algarum TaxID=3050085 RepID=A0ABS9D4M4_9ALTE|nr:sulfatase-like hydrolase/transferase [Paraglaciecola sp. G1-23]MCF2947893.1 sulfatase-like hydrolase/transferase [Paraglaciecola sp. G1-23]
MKKIKISALIPMALMATLSLMSCSVAKQETTTAPVVDKATTSKTSDKPNILFIFADDQSPKTLGAYGNQHIKTPNLDKLAQNGVNFNNAYNMGAWNGAVCQASRAMLNSGRSVWQAHKMDRQFAQGKGVETTWAKLLEKEGYDTYMAGKWHVAASAEKVFQNAKHVRPGMPDDAYDHASQQKIYDDFMAGKTDYKSPGDFLPVGYNRPLSKNDDSWSPTDPKFTGFWKGGKHWSEVLKDDTLGFIEQAKASDNPFFMYVAFNAPHDPRQAPQAYQDMYDEESLPLPSNWADNYPERDFIGNSARLRDAALAPFPRTEYATRVHLKEYYALISHLDTQVGEILAVLKASGKMDNTYIIYTADHGLAVGERGLFGKQNMYEESVRAPFIIWGPGIEGGQTVDADIYLQDVMATSLEIAGAEKPDYVFFNSIIDLAKGKTTNSHYDAIYGAYIDSQRMIKKDGFKLLVYPLANTIKLFDLAADPDEVTNLANQAKYKSKVRNLFAELIKLQADLEDEMDLTAMYQAL